MGKGLIYLRDNGIDGIAVIAVDFNKISIDVGIITANCGAFDAEVAALLEIIVDLDLSF